MADPEKDKAGRNRDVIARMSVPPNKAQILAELGLEIGDAIRLATAADFSTLVRLLRTAKAEVVELRGRPEFKDKP